MSKRPEYKIDPDLSGATYWRSLKEYEGDQQLVSLRTTEFAPGVTDEPDEMSRRTFFNLMGAATAMAGLAACRRPEEKIVPFASAPEHTIPGRPEQYATTLVFAGSAFGVLVESHDGRPTKIEGNPQHPESAGGGLLPWVQASILELYDPDRSSTPKQKVGGKHEDRTWAEAGAALAKLGQASRAGGGASFAVVTTGHRSPTLAIKLAELRRELPQARIVRWEPLSLDAAREGARLAFGKPLTPVLDLKNAKVIVTLDADILDRELGPVKNARAFADGRRAVGPDMNRLYAVESELTTTGSAADHRLRLTSRDVSGFAVALAAELAKGGAVAGDLASAGAARTQGLSPRAQEWAKVVAADLIAKKGAGLVVAGGKQPAWVHALCHAMNHGLGNVPATIKFVRPFDENGEGPAGLQALTTAIEAGQVTNLLILGGNPAFDAPADVAFAAALGRPGVTAVHLSSHFDETSELCAWHLNRSHELEAWGDAESEDRTPSIVQPLIAPLFDSRSEIEVVSLLLGKNERGFDQVRATWMPRLALGGEKAWRRALHDGVIAGVEGFPAAAEAVAVNAGALAGALRALPPASAGTEVTFVADPHAWDGRFANNSWLQEWPDPMHKQTWGNRALVSPATAKKLGVSDGATIAMAVGEGLSARAAVIVAPGQADDSIAVSVGQGRRKAGRVGTGVGTDTYALRTAAALGYAGDVKVSVLGGDAKLARTQEHFNLEGRPHVRAGTLADYQKDPAFQKKFGIPHPELKSLWKDQKVDIVHAWGMAIDLGTCTGCGACMVACQAENNIPVVGADGVRKSREMNWLRVDRYFEGSPDEPRAVAQPLPCQQCENAPCEQVCPVAATTHSPEGLNDMAYNRCVGTRYCANNCPFKVRKFNFLNYTKHTPALKQMQYNPDVTVRSRGVMEKCTFCTQRISEAKIAYKRQGTEVIPDGTIVTACEQACPSGAIVFGDLNDKNSRVSKAHADPRSYKLLEEINVRPRVAYLAKIRNLNPELEKA